MFLIPVVLESRRSSRGVRTPCTHPLDPPLVGLGKFWPPLFTFTSYFIILVKNALVVVTWNNKNNSKTIVGLSSAAERPNVDTTYKLSGCLVGNAWTGSVDGLEICWRNRTYFIGESTKNFVLSKRIQPNLTQTFCCHVTVLSRVESSPQNSWERPRMMSRSMKQVGVRM